jgi:hypothetical protein
VVWCVGKERSDGEQLSLTEEARLS